MASVFLLAGLTAAVPAFAQTRGLEAHCETDSIVVDFSGPVPPNSGPIHFVWRKDVSVCGPWTALGNVVWGPPGETIQIHRADGDVVPGHLYRYRLGYYPEVETPPVWNNWLYLYDAWAGCGEAVVAHGTLHRVPFDWYTMIEPTNCAGGCYPTYLVGNAWVDLSPYVDTTTEVALFGSVGFSSEVGWELRVDRVEPRACDIIAVQPATWTRVKGYYR
jgi:hypothetical protein